MPKILPPVFKIPSVVMVTPAPPVITAVSAPVGGGVVVEIGPPANCIAPCSRYNVVNALGASMSSKDVTFPEDKTSAISCALLKDSVMYSCVTWLTLCSSIGVVGVF